MADDKKYIKEVAFVSDGQTYYARFGGSCNSEEVQGVAIDVTCFSSNDGSLNYNQIRYWQIWGKIVGSELCLKLQDRDGDIFGEVYCPFRCASIAVNTAAKDSSDLYPAPAYYFGFNSVKVSGFKVIPNGVLQYGNDTASDGSVSMNTILEISAEKESSRDFVLLGEFYFRATLNSHIQTSKPLFIVSVPIPKS